MAIEPELWILAQVKMVKNKLSSQTSKYTVPSKVMQLTQIHGSPTVPRIAYNVFNMDKRLGFIAKLPLIIGGFFELG